MGAPKKKWSLEEEAALKAGIERYGAGKWSAILNDPDYQSVLSARTNVDLKDKWRNINVMLNGVGYRQRGMGVPKVKSAPKNQNKNVAAASGAMVKYVAPKSTKNPKLQQNKDPAPAMPAAAAATGAATASGPALVVKPPENLNNAMQIDLQASDMEIVQVDSPKATSVVKYEFGVELQGKMLEEGVEVVDMKYGGKVKNEIDYVLKKLVDMTAEEAAIAAGEAVAEAEVAIERAERALREAEAAEWEAEAARVFSEAAQIACKRVW